MATDLSTKPIISRLDLLAITESRLKEAESLLVAEHYAASIYLAGLAVECCLKAAICKSLDWDHLLGMFKSHDLTGLLAYSGYDRELRENPAMVESFSRLARMWSVETNEPGGVRYEPPGSYDERKANEFLRWVHDQRTGVIPWLLNRIV